MESQFDQDLQQSKKLDYLEGVLENQKGLKTINKLGGIGGFGVVLFVEDKNNPSLKYAVKTQNILDQNTGKIDQSLQKMCEDEAEMMRQCKHKNVVEIHSDYIIDFYHFIQMNLCKCSLSDWIDNNQSPINDILFLHYTNQIIDGLEYLHNKQYVLRDLSIRNILLTTDEVIKLCDFGLAKKYDQFLQSEILLTKNPKGVFFYFPPEIYEDMNNNKQQIKQTIKGDIWALGICLSLLGGTKILEFLNVQNKNFQIPISQKVSQKANQLIKFILNRDPQQRPTIKQIREKICEIFLSNPVLDQSETNKQNVDVLNSVVINIKSKADISNLSTQQNTIYSSASLIIERLIDYDFDQCEKLYQKYSKFENQFQINIDFLLTLGYLEAKYKSNYQKAQQIFERVLELDENETDALMGLCHCFMQQRLYKEHHKILQYSNICLNKVPNSWRAQYYKAYYFYYNMIYHKALEILQKIQLEKPECCEALSLKLVILLERKTEENEKDIIDKIIMLNKNNNPIVFFRIGIYYNNRQEIQKSLHYLNKCLNYTQNELSVLVYSAYVQSDNEQEVKKLISKAEQLYPQSAYLFKWKSIISNNKQTQINFINKSIELDSCDIGSIRQKAIVLKSLNKYKESIECYEKIILINPDCFWVFYDIAKIYGNELNQKVKAIDLIKKCINEDPHCMDYYLELSELYKNQSYCKDFEKIIKDNIEKSNLKLFLSKLLAKMQLDNKDYDQFIQYINKALQIDPQDTESLNIYGDYFKLIKIDLKKAKQYYEKVLELDPKYQNIYFNLGYVEENQGKKIQYYKKQLELNPDSGVTINNLGTIYEEQDKYDEALKLYQLAFQKNKSSILFSSNIQNTFYNLKLYDQALEQCDITLKLDSKHFGSYQIKGNIYKLRGEHLQAVENFEKALEYDQSKKFLYQDLADEYFELKRKSEALKCYQKFIQAYPNNPEALYMIGFLLISLSNDNLNQAVSYFEKSIKAQPTNNSKAYKQLGLLQIQKNQYDFAKQNLIKAIEQDKLNIDLYLNLSRNEQFNLKNINQAILYLEKYIKFYPSDKDEKLNLIKMHINNKEYIKSRQLLKQFIQDSPDNYSAYFQFARLESCEDNYFESIVQYEKAFSLNKNSYICIFNIGIQYQNLKKYQKAVEYYLKYNKLEKGCGRGYFQIGKIQLYNFKKPKKSIQYFKKCQELPVLPNNSFNQNDIYYHIGKCFVELNYISEAVSQFTKYLQKNPTENVKYCQDYIKNFQNYPKKFYKYQPLNDSICSCNIF